MKIRLLLDKFSVELFINDGIQTFTSVFYTPLEAEEIVFFCAAMGKQGSRAYYKGSRVECAPFLNEKTIETTGAGDTFMVCVLNKVLEYGLENLDEEKLYGMLEFCALFFQSFSEFLKIPQRYLLLMTLRYVIKWPYQEVKSYVKIHDGRTCEALRRVGADGAVL